MNTLGEIHWLTDDTSRWVGIYAIILLTIYFVWQILHWFFTGPKTPDPWDGKIADALDDAKPVCPHCLTAHGELEHFCSNCGAAVGDFTNVMPFLNLFSISHTLRIGTMENYKPSRLMIFGFFFIGFAQYLIFAPVYWFRVMQNLRRLRRTPEAEVSTSSDLSQS